MNSRRTRLSGLRTSAVLLALLLGLLAGCGGSDGDGDSGGSGGGDASSESEDAAGSDDVDAAIERCKDAVQTQIDAGTAPESVQAELDAICESVTDASPEEARRVTIETCVAITVEVGGGVVDEATAKTQCEQSIPE